MDYWALFTLGAIGWGGFVGCLVVLKQKRRINVWFPAPTGYSPLPEDWKNQVQGSALSGSIAIGTKASANSGGQVAVGRSALPSPQPTQQVEIEREIPDELHELAALASPFIDEIDATPQDGEWKRHQVYAKMLKRAPINGDKWKAAFAIELAIAQRRMGD